MCNLSVNFKYISADFRTNLFFIWISSVLPSAEMLYTFSSELSINFRTGDVRPPPPPPSPLDQGRRAAGGEGAVVVVVGRGDGAHDHDEEQRPP